MSLSEYHKESKRWLATAEMDIKAARALADAQLFAHACFQCQQAAEKAVKAVWYFQGIDPWGHSVQKLISEFQERMADSFPNSLQEKAALLDRFYIPTRYPNGLPDLTPSDNYFRSDADHAVSIADEILSACRKLINN